MTENFFNLDVQKEPNIGKQGLLNEKDHQNDVLQLGNLKSQLNKSMNQLNLKSKICDSEFSKRGYLKNHMIFVHEGKKPFECQACNYRCSRKAFLKKHIASVHKEGKQRN